MKKLNETEIIGVPPSDSNNQTYSGLELDEIEKVLLPILSNKELKEYKKLSPDERAQYLNGFADNINEWKKAKEAANKPQLDGGMPGMPGMQPPDDGLDHWQPAKRSNDENSDSQNNKGNQVFSDAEEELNKAELACGQSAEQAENKKSLASNSMDPQDLAQNADKIADAAQQAADAAQQAADAAQNAANQADENAQESGKSSDIENADKSQMSANTSLDLANQAQAAANKSRELADEAQQAADNGDAETAAQKMKESYEAAMDAVSKSKGAQANARDAIKNGKKTSGAGLSDSDFDNMSALQAAQEALEAAKKAQQAAEEAQAAADAAQAKADETGKPFDLGAADDAQKMADAAKKAAEEAQAAADAAMDAARKGDSKGAQENAKNANRLSNKAQANNKSALSQLNSQSGEQGESSDSGDPILSKADTEFDPNGEVVHERKMDMDMNFDGNDFAGDSDEMVKQLLEIAKQAGLPLDPEDYASREDYAARKFTEALPALREWKKHNNPGRDGNPPSYLEEVMKKLFESHIDWRDKIENFLTDNTPVGKYDIYAKRRMGLDAAHPLYKGRYLRPNERTYEKRTGLAQVFFLVDASGSMGVRCNDGVNIFEHIMSELIQIELAVKIRYSAYASFNCGPILRDDVFTWTYQDASDEDELLLQFVLPVANGGTSAIQGIKSIQEFDDVYSMQEPWTLLIVVTDGGDNYDGLKKICKDPEQTEHMIWVITSTDDNWFKSKCEELKKLGVPEDHIIEVNIDKEWGVGPDSVKRK